MLKITSLVSTTAYATTMSSLTNSSNFYFPMSWLQNSNFDDMQAKCFHFVFHFSYLCFGYFKSIFDYLCHMLNILHSYQAALINIGPPRKHIGAITAPIIPVCTIHASCLAPTPGLYSIPRTTIPEPIIRPSVIIIDWKRSYINVKKNSKWKIKVIWILCYNNANK